jgi:hypothetical protein
VLCVCEFGGVEEEKGKKMERVEKSRVKKLHECDQG